MGQPPANAAKEAGNGDVSSSVEPADGGRKSKIKKEPDGGCVLVFSYVCAVDEIFFAIVYVLFLSSCTFFIKTNKP